MHFSHPEVILLMRPQIVAEGMDRWLKSIGAENYIWKKTDSDAENAIMAFAKRCYMAFEPGLNPNVRKVREDISNYLENILSSRHGSVTAHASFSFAIEGVSRVFTGEMNRHAIGMAISEGSMRFISFEDLGLVKTASMKDPQDEHDEIVNHFLESSFREDEERYSYMMSDLKQKGYDNLPFSRKKELTSKARRAIGMGIATGGVWTGNIRALRWICEQRGTPHAEEEILVVAQQILFIMMKECPHLFGDFKPLESDERFYQPLYSKV